MIEDKWEALWAEIHAALGISEDVDTETVDAVRELALAIYADAEDYVSVGGEFDMYGELRTRIEKLGLDTTPDSG